ncbi:Anthrone oxygenase encC [Erysiphe neolycopersici]|uniref:Anthrone oxygenase encC n=1 Tax=Erysiphe neolycopersici TaxID=212602 RepID=A0A420HZZ7_9PEZI|nr:Anthrone oxygenase encC [Erysiphe neolycopersici]
MSDLPISVRVAQAVGIFGALFSAGSMICTSRLVIPAIRQSPTPLLLSQWKNIYTIGSRTAPKMALITSTAMAYVSYHFCSSSEGKLWALASVLAISIIPYTIVVVFPTNKFLEEWHKKEGLGIDRKDVDEKINEWTYKHSIRTYLTLSGGLIALFAVIRRS